MSAPTPTAIGWPAALEDVVNERLRQVHEEGWTPEHDDQHGDGSLALAAACYAMFASVSDRARAMTDLPASLTATGHKLTGWAAWLEIWPWDRRWWKPKDRRRDLVRAAALIIAEIERLDRRHDRDRPVSDVPAAQPPIMGADTHADVVERLTARSAEGKARLAADTPAPKPAAGKAP